MKEIPCFSMNESEGIGAACEEAGIPYELQTVMIQGGVALFNVCVSDEQFIPAVQVIKSFYGFLDAPAEAVSGVCPACNAAVENVLECSDCGLTLSFDSRDAMEKHPFTVFLEKLEKDGTMARWSAGSV